MPKLKISAFPSNLSPQVNESLVISYFLFTLFAFFEIFPSFFPRACTDSHPPKPWSSFISLVNFSGLLKPLTFLSSLLSVLFKPFTLYSCCKYCTTPLYFKAYVCVFPLEIRSHVFFFFASLRLPYKGAQTC